MQSFPVFSCKVVLVMLTGQQLRAKREKRGWTQQELADRLGVTMRTVGNWERGETIPRTRSAAIDALFADRQDADEATASLHGASNLALVTELLRRLDAAEKQGGSSDAGQAEDEKSRDDGREGGRVTPIGRARWEMPGQAAARRGQRARDQED